MHNSPKQMRPQTMDEVVALSDAELEQIIVDCSTNREETTRSMIETSRGCNDDHPERFRRFHEKLAATHLGIPVTWQDKF